MLKTSKVFLGGLLLIASTTSMAGAIYNEVGDAGQTLATAQLVNTLPGEPLLMQSAELWSRRERIYIEFS